MAMYSFCHVQKLDTRIPMPVRQVLPKTQRPQTRDCSGSRIPCPISTQQAPRKRFSREGDKTIASQAPPCRRPLGVVKVKKCDKTMATPCRRPDETMTSQAPACRRPDEGMATVAPPCRRSLGESRIPTSCRRTPGSQLQTPSCKRKISFGGTQVSYFEDELPTLLEEAVEAHSRQTVDPACLSLDPATSFQQYKSMIEEEKKEIRDMHVVVTQLLDRPKVEFRDMYTLVPSISYIDEGASETAPEVAAAMLHSDELGLNMKSPPAEVYNTLFKGGEKDKTVIRVAMEDNAEILVPISSEGFEATLQGYEQRGLFENVSDSFPQYNMPEMPRPKKKDQKEGEEGESETAKGGPPVTEKGEADPTEEKPIGQSESEDLEGSSQYNVHLKAEADAGYDFLQVRGSQPPSWWPGYYVAMGDSSKINVVSKPWDVFEKAWRKLAPNNLKPDNGTYVIGI